ncbi:MAG: PspA/IM30 family protein [Betaproteobacteria bacterium]|nr:PspA/IM30 family protein [Betaproteobacteria bacterium]
MLTSFIVAVVGVIALLWWSGNLGKVGFLVKGFTSLFVERRIQTIEGLEAAYTQAIAEMRKQHAQIAETFQKVSGLRQLTEREIGDLQTQVEEAKSNVDKFILADDERMATECAETLSRYASDLKAKEPLLLPMKAHETSLQKMLGSVEANIRALEAEKHEELNKMRTNQTIKEVNDRMNSLGTSIDVRVLEVAKQGARAAEADALGSATLQEISSNSRMTQVIDATNKLNASSYLQQRKRELIHSGTPVGVELVDAPNKKPRN